MEEYNRMDATARELQNIKWALDKSAIVAITDKAGKIIHVNDKFCEISKYSRDELMGKNHRLINSGYHPRAFFEEMWKAISGGHVWEGEIRNRAKDGTYYWVHTTIVPFLDENKKPFQYVSIRFEITSRKIAEERLKSYAARLEVSNRELQDFASIAAHDLQEPLRKIQAFSDRLKTKYRDILPDEGQDYFDRILGSAVRMQKLIEDLLTFSRVTTKGQPFVTVELNQILNDVQSDLEMRIERTNAKIESDPLPAIDADPSQMRQLFQNLLSNALKFHRAGEAPYINVASSTRNGWCEIRVEDNGIGFEEKYLDKIFTIFQRLHGRHEYEGTGIGLAVCRRIAERHGGSITAKSRVGAGSTFIITLPVRQRKGDSE